MGHPLGEVIAPPAGAACDYWQTALVRLRPFEATDTETCWRWGQDGQRARDLDHVWPPASRAQLQASVDRKARQHFDNADFDFMIENIAGHPIGAISTHRCDQRTGTFSYGIDISAGHRRKSYATHAIILLLGYYFNECRYQKVTVSIHAENQASCDLHRKLGFVEEGRLRRMVYTAGRLQDELWFGQTAEEFATR